MGIPKNPDTKILVNKFYPKGFTEQDNFKYYQSVKSKLLREMKHRDAMIFFANALNETIILRAIKKHPIILTNNNYERIISGRTLSFHGIMTMYERFGIVDVDCDNWELVKEATLKTYEVLKKQSFIWFLRIQYTGKTGFHIHCHFQKKMKIELIRQYLNKILRKAPELNLYTIQYRRMHNIVNLDLRPNVIRGGFIFLHSLSVSGLKCMEIEPEKLMSFQKEEAKVF